MAGHRLGGGANVTREILDYLNAPGDENNRDRPATGGRSGFSEGVRPRREGAGSSRVRTVDLDEVERVPNRRATWTSPRPSDAIGSHPAIEVDHLRKAYGEKIAVDDVSFSVSDGEIFGLLGPNGAGKTTTVECVVGLRTADAGRVRVLGLDPERDRESLRRVVGVQLQSSALPAKLRVGELLDLYQSFYAAPADVDELAETLGLADKRSDYYRSLSGGQKQRISVALALIGQPKVAVLDEMTTGLDPPPDSDAWNLIRADARPGGVTILLVTHFMEEAERLCDKVAELSTKDTSWRPGHPRIWHRTRTQQNRSTRPLATFEQRLLTDLPEVASVEHHGQRGVHVNGSGDLVNAVIQSLAAVGVTAHNVELSTTTLEDAFVKLTGRPVASAHAGSQPPLRGKQICSDSRDRRPVLAKGAPRRAFGKLVQAECVFAWRQPIGLGFGLGLPVLLLVTFGSLVSREHQKSFGGLTFLDVWIPTLIVFLLAGLAFFVVPTPLATYREQGILRRLSTTPVPPSWVLGAELVVNGCIAAEDSSSCLWSAPPASGSTSRRTSVASSCLSALLALPR